MPKEKISPVKGFDCAVGSSLHNFKSRLPKTFPIVNSKTMKSELENTWNPKDQAIVAIENMQNGAQTAHKLQNENGLSSEEIQSSKGSSLGFHQEKETQIKDANKILIAVNKSENDFQKEIESAIFRGSGIPSISHGSENFLQKGKPEPEDKVSNKK
jgi:hypothetical protein